MNTPKTMITRAGLLVAAAALAACSGIGEGSTVQSMKVAFSPADIRDQAAVVDAGLPTQKLRMYDCFCANVAVIGTFTGGTLANFNSRAKWTSSDPAIVSVLNYGDTLDARCPLAQQAPGLLVPHGPGTVTVTAEYLGFRPTFTIEVADTNAEAAGSFLLKPTDPTNSGQVAVGALLPTTLSATLDGRPRTLNLNATYVMNPVADTVAKIDTTGRVTGFSADLGTTPLAAKATFGTCSVTVTHPIRVGEVTSPLTISEEPGLASDSRLAVSSNEIFGVTAALDFGDGGALGSQSLTEQSTINFTDPCTLREYDATVLNTSCKETSTACANTVPVCSDASATTCTSGMTACRTVASPMIGTGLTRAIAVADATAATTFRGLFPAVVGAATTVVGAIGAADPSFTIGTFSNYPTILPWEGVIEGEVPASKEIVQVTAVTGTTLTVTRGYAGTTAVSHPAGASFNQRRFTSDNTADVTATAGTLTSFGIESTPATLPLYSSVQLQALGTYENTTAMTSRTQRVTHATVYLAGSAGMLWTSSAPLVAIVNSNTGLVTTSNPCGGTAVIRARATTSTDPADGAFAKPDTAAAGADDADANGNTDANDTACTTTDPLCDQVTLTVPRASPLPPGYTAEFCDSL